MRRLFPQLSEVTAGGHDAPSKMILPNPVYNHPRGQLIILSRDPIRERSAPPRRASESRNLQLYGLQHRQKTGRYFVLSFACFEGGGNGAVMYALEGQQPHYGTMPRAILEVMKIFMGTAGWPTQTLGGELFIVIVRFQALCLLGLLIEVMGGFMRGLLFGINDGGSLHGGEAAKTQGAALHDDR